MAAYFFVDLDITDLEGFREYQKQVGATVEQYGGKFLVRGGNYEVIEGELPLHRLVIIEFPSVEQAKLWFDSAEYAPLIPIRHRTAHTQAILIQGV